MNTSLIVKAIHAKFYYCKFYKTKTTVMPITN